MAQKIVQKSKSSTEYWRKREEENLKKNLLTEEEYVQHIHDILDYTADQIQREINGFYSKYARQEGISLAEAKRRIKSADVEEFARKAKKYVKEKDFSKQANEEMRLYNATMKINRLELLKANIGLELVSGFDELQKYNEEILTDRTKEELERQAGILGGTVQNNEKMVNSIVNGSFHNATYSERIWLYQDMMRNELDKLLRQGLIQGKNPRQLATHLQKLFGTCKYVAERLMRTELTRVQIDAQKQSFEKNGYDQYTFLSLGSACGSCRSLNGKHFEVSKMMPGDNAPPIHPNCRCSVSAYIDDDSYNEWLDTYKEHGLSYEEWNRSNNMALRDDEISWPERGTPISKEQYRELAAYARDKGIALEGFKRFDGDIDVIKEVIDDADVIAKRFPALKEGRRKLTISLDEYMDSPDFAITNNHIIRLNAAAFRNVECLKREYNKLAEEGWFVKGTDCRSIIRHEMGHVIANIYKINGLSLAKEITGIASTEKLMEYLQDNLSIYASSYENGEEIISECFSCIFSGIYNEFSLRFVESWGFI